MKYLLVFPLFAAICTGGLLYWLDHGYVYYPPATIQADIKGTYQYTVECQQRQSELEALEQSIQAQMQPLADKLINGPFPVPNGQSIYNEYNSLRLRLNKLQSEYAC